MKLVIQRVSEASVSVDNELISKIGKGLLVLVGIAKDDTIKDLEYAAQKLVQMRIFPDQNGVMNISVTEAGGALLLVSQFTLLAQTRKGNRPSYIDAAAPDMATRLYDDFCEMVAQKTGQPVAKGIFGADMQVALINDGPVTIVLDSKQP
ncbi:MAG TPA: D-aminoacyl-tRNA deacylase [Edaphocola sp.]|nr:D-aminoacyl-tRNA deacylase [Edaphocola sp.]